MRDVMVSSIRFTPNCWPCANNLIAIASCRALKHTPAARCLVVKLRQASTHPIASGSRSTTIRQLLKSDTKNAKTVPVVLSSKPFAGTMGNVPSGPNTNKGYPERLLIYDAGLGRTLFISFFKLTAVFIFIFSSVLIAPGYYYSAYEATWMAPAVVIGGAVPMLVMMFTTAPFVTYVHLALPLWARASQTRLLRYSQNLPSTAVLDVTSLRWIWPRVTRLHVSELYIKQSQIGSMTIRRNVPKAVSESRKWWHWRPLARFYISGKGGKTAEPGIWGEVVGCIARASSKRDARLEVKLPFNQ